MSEINYEQAKKTFEALCSYLEKKDWSYDKNTDDLSVECGVRGEDFTIELSVRVDAKRELVILMSRIPFTVKEDKILDIAIAVSAINNMLVDGSFDFNVKTGSIFFRMTNSFMESDIGESVFEYMLLCSSHTIDEYNDKLFMISKDMLSLEKFISDING